MPKILTEIYSSLEETNKVLPTTASTSIYNHLITLFPPATGYPRLDITKALAEFSQYRKKLQECEADLEDIKAQAHEKPDSVDKTLLEKTSKIFTETSLKILIVSNYLIISDKISSVLTDIAKTVKNDETLQRSLESIIIKIVEIEQLIKEITIATQGVDLIKEHDLTILNCWLDFARGFLLIKHRLLNKDHFQKGKEKNFEHWKYLQKILDLPEREYITSPTRIYNLICNSLVAQTEDDPFMAVKNLPMIIETFCKMINTVEKNMSLDFIIKLRDDALNLIGKIVNLLTTPIRQALFLMQIKINADIDPVLKKPIEDFASSLLDQQTHDSKRVAQRIIDAQNRSLLQPAEQHSVIIPPQTLSALPPQQIQADTAASSSHAKKKKKKRPKTPQKKPVVSATKIIQEEKPAELQTPKKSPTPRTSEDAPIEQKQTQVKSNASPDSKDASSSGGEDMSTTGFTLVSYSKRGKQAMQKAIQLERKLPPQQATPPHPVTTSSAAKKAKKQRKLPLHLETLKPIVIEQIIAPLPATISAPPVSDKKHEQEQKAEATLAIQPQQPPLVHVAPPLPTINLDTLHASPDQAEILATTIAHIKQIIIFINQLKEQFPDCEINLFGSNALNLLVTANNLDSKITLPSDLDLEIIPSATTPIDKLGKYLEDQKFKKNPFLKETYTYHPDPISVLNPLPFSVDIKIALESDPNPCFNIDTLRISLPKLTYNFPHEKQTNWFAPVWFPTHNTATPVPTTPPTIAEIAERNPKTILRALRLSFIHELPQAKYTHITSALQNEDTQTVKKLLCAINFPEFKTELGKLFMRGYAHKLMSDQTQAHQEIRNALLAIIKPLFPNFHSVMMQKENPSGSTINDKLQLFILNKLQETDKLANDKTSPTHPSICAIFALMLLPKYISEKKGIGQDPTIIINDITALSKHFKTTGQTVTDLTKWLNESSQKYPWQIYKFLIQYQQEFAKQLSPSISIPSVSAPLTIAPSSAMFSLSPSKPSPQWPNPEAPSFFPHSQIKSTPTGLPITKFTH